MTTEQIFWGIALILISSAAGVGGKIFYDMIRYKAPPREGLDKHKFPDEYNADLCTSRHNEIDKDLLCLREEDTKTVSCLNHMKAKLHGLEIVTVEHQQKLESDDRRIISMEKSMQSLKEDYSELKHGQNEIRNGIMELLRK